MAPTVQKSHGSGARSRDATPAVVSTTVKPKRAKKRSDEPRRYGVAVSVVMPLLELGAIGYASWVFVYLVCVQYLIRPSADIRRKNDIQPRRSTATALIVVYALLLMILLITWSRLLQVIWTGLDLVPLGDRAKEKEEMSTKKLDKYDAYICDYQGLPIWCDTCHNWKPDRTHHCKELNRCVRKMDHYCPWAGGIIGESSHKFFLQFVCYTAIYCLYTLVVLAVFLGEHARKIHSRPPTWICAIAAVAWFFFFTFSMTIMTGWNLMINFTSVEGIQKEMVHNIAFLISRTPKEPASPPSTGDTSKQEPYTSHSENTWPVLCIVQRSARRSYVVMQTRPQEHPWYTTFMMGWKDTMGKHFIDWILPIKHSPCKKRTRRGEFEWGEVVFDMARKYETNNPGTCLTILNGIR